MYQLRHPESCCSHQPCSIAWPAARSKKNLDECVVGAIALRIALNSRCDRNRCERSPRPGPGFGHWFRPPTNLREELTVWIDSTWRGGFEKFNKLLELSKFAVAHLVCVAPRFVKYKPTFSPRTLVTFLRGHW